MFYPGSDRNYNKYIVLRTLRAHLMTPAKTIIFLFLLLASVCGCFLVFSFAGLFAPPGAKTVINQSLLRDAAILSASLSEAAGQNASLVAQADYLAADSYRAAGADSLLQGAVNIERDGSAIKVLVTVYNAGEVSLYLEGGVLPAPLYLGRAVYEGDGVWIYNFNLESRPLPNGNYRIYAQVTQGSSIANGTPTALIIDNKPATDSARIAAIEKTIGETNLAIEVNSQAIARAVKTAADTVAANIGTNATAENISQIAALTQVIEQTSLDLAAAILERQEENRLIREQETLIASLAENTIKSIKAEKIEKLNASKAKAKELDRKISDLQAMNGENENKRASLAREVSAFAAENNRGRITRILEDMEKEVASQERDNVAKRLILARDGDRDGASDAQEILAGTDPLNPDTDSDGALDGDEMEHGYNPLTPEEFTRVEYGDPRAVPPRQADVYKVERISSVALAGSGRGIRLEGHGLPNSYVTLFVYSVPVIGIVKTDASGNWNYELDQKLSAGEHMAYAALVGAAGSIVARSEQFVFVVTATAVTQKISNPEAEISASVDDLQNKFKAYLPFIVFLAMAAALLMIGIAARSRKGKEDAFDIGSNLKPKIK